MIYLVGEGTGPKWDARLREFGLGRMFTERKPATYPGEPWGWDNGAFIAWSHGQAFDLYALFARLKRDRAIGTPYLAVCPDIVAGGSASLALSLRARAALPDDWPWYLAVQNGMTPKDVLRHLPGFVGLFLGGDNGFKAQAPLWCAFAHDHGKLFHYGRAGTLAKLEHAVEVGVDSADSAFPMWTNPRWVAFVEALQHRPQIQLWGAA